jgi:hypothetical protein
LPVLERRQVDATHVAIDPDHGWESGREVEVGSALLGRKRQEFGDIHADLPVAVWCPGRCACARRATVVRIIAQGVSR